MSEELKIEIPTEHQVVIDGVTYDKRSPEIKEDYFSPGSYINIYSNAIYNSFNIITGINNGGLIVNTGYTNSSTGRMKRVLINYSFANPRYRDRFFFKSDKEIDDFCEKYDFKYGINTGCYYHSSMMKYDRAEPYYFSNIKNKLCPIYLEKNGIIPKKSKEYEELINHYNSINEKYGLDSKTFLSFEGLTYTFGVELETVTGSFGSPQDFELVKDLNILSVKDGSLRDADGSGPWGAEYVTGVLKGDNGLNHLHNITKALAKKCTVDKRASVHVHIGSLKWNSEDIVYAYILGMMLEDEIFSMMPKSRLNNQYCKKLIDPDFHMLNRLNKPFDKSEYKKITNLAYNKVFGVVSKGIKPNKQYNKKSRHPDGPHGGWNRDTDHRYSWLNFTNIIFNQRGSMDSKTIEFRCHSGTLSYKKIHNWIKLCMAIVEFVNIGKKDILKAYIDKKPIKLEDIVSKIYPKSGKRLNEYIQIRKDLFSIKLNEDLDYTTEDSNIKNIKDIVCV